MSRLGDTIKQARLNSKMTEKALAKKCGMSEGVIKQIEAGTRIVSDDQAQRILKLLGVKNPVSTELEVAMEPEVKLRPKPRAYVIPVPEPETKVAAASHTENDGATDAWLDALGGVVKRVPVMDENGVVIDHVLEPIIGGKIEGGAPDKVIYYRCPDDSLRGYRVHAGDLLLTVPTNKIEDGQIMLIVYKDARIVRKINKLDGSRLLLQSYDREFMTQTVPYAEVRVMGKCVKLERRL